MAARRAPGQELVALVASRAHAVERATAATEARPIGVAERPAVALLLSAAEDVQLVVPEDHRRGATIAQVADQAAHAGAVRAAVDEVADEYDRPLHGAGVGVTAEPTEQATKPRELAVDVPDDIEGTVG